MADAVLFEVRGAVGLITLNRPEKANTISDTLIDGIQAALEAAESNEQVGALVVTGAGRHFCGGADLGELSLSRLSASGARARIGIEFDLFSKPVIAAINGAAMGGGCEIALTCDFRFMAIDATIGLPEITFGALPAAGGTVRLPRLIGTAKAKKLIMTGRPWSASEAFACGLVDEVLPLEDLLTRSLEFAGELSTHAAFATRAAKSLINAAHERPLEEALLHERQVIAHMATPDELRAARKAAAAKSATYAKIFEAE